jgi:DNA helicase-2/ATP-dependent DNA helicase PcrA
LPIAEQLEKWRTLANELRPPDLLRHVIEQSGLARYYEKETNRRGHLQELVRFFRLQDSADSPCYSMLEELVQRVALARNVDHLDPNDPRVPIITVHQAKGLEFDTVFLPGISDGEFPSYYACRDGLEEEERRLFYVGMTRARRRLFISAYSKNEKDRQVGASSFFRCS